MNDPEVLDLALDLLRKEGVEGEVYLERSITTKIAVHEGKLESLVERRDHGAGVRVFAGQRTAFAFATDLSQSGLSAAIGRACAIAPHAKLDEANVLPGIAPALPPLVNVDHRMESVPVAEKVEIAKEVEASARAESPKIQKIREASYQDFLGTIYIANSRGQRITHEAGRSYASISLAATDSSGSQTGHCVGWALGPHGLDPAAIGREGARRGLRKLGAVQPATARTTVVLDPEATAELFGALAPLFSADAVLKDRTLLATRVGDAVASSRVTLVDDGGIAGGFSSAPVDGEGTPTRESVLIDGGVLRGFFQTAFTARKMGVSPTGNGVRGGYAGSPEPSPTNLYLRPTGVPRKTLLGMVSSGIYITELMGLHTIDTITGDFSLGASGQALRDGRLDRPLDRMAISGNVLELLMAVEQVATDLTFLVTGGGATVLLRDISVSGSGS